MRRGCLTIVGTGIGVGHLTAEARAFIENSKCLLAIVADPLTLEWLEEINPTTECLLKYYGRSKSRHVTYEQMVRRTLTLLRRGKDVCLVVYGHPGVFAYPPHELMRRAATEKIRARMLPAVSAEDCLFADLGVDPGEFGCQSFEATDFLLRHRQFDPTSSLVLWQFGGIAEPNYPTRRRTRGVRVLAKRLAQVYGWKHNVVIYKAPTYPVFPTLRLKVPLSGLAAAEYDFMCTLYVPPLENRQVDLATCRELGIKRTKASAARARRHDLAKAR